MQSIGNTFNKNGNRRNIGKNNRREKKKTTKPGEFEVETWEKIEKNIENSIV